MLASTILLVAAFGVPAARFNLTAAGLACWVGATLFGHLIR